KHFFIKIWEINNKNNRQSRQGSKSDRTCSNVFYETNLFMIIGVNEIADFFNGSVQSLNAQKNSDCHNLKNPFRFCNPKQKPGDDKENSQRKLSDNRMFCRYQ